MVLVALRLAPIAVAQETRQNKSMVNFDLLDH